MEQQRSAGGVVFRGVGSAARVLLIQDRFGRWTFPKGHIEPGETAEQAAVREIREETGCAGRIVAPLGQMSYRFQTPLAPVEKSVEFFLVETESVDLRPQPGEVEEARWVTVDEALVQLGYDNMLPILNRAIAKMP